MALTTGRSTRLAVFLSALIAVSANAQNPAEVTRYQVTDTVLEIAPGTTMFALVWQYYPEHKAHWLAVAADLAEANPHAFRNGDPGDVIVGEQLRLIEYPEDTATATAAVSERAAPSRPVSKAIEEKAAPAAVRTAGTGAATPAQGAPRAESVAATATAIGKVTTANGNLRAVGADGQARVLRVNGEVLAGDTLIAALDADVAIKMIDDAVVELHGGAHVIFEDYNYGTPGARNHSTITLLEGGLRIVTGAIAKADPEAVFINTPMATIGVHSADFALRLCASGACRVPDSDRPLLAGLYAGVLDGEVAIANNTGNLNLARGEFIRVRNQDTEPDPAVEAAQLLFEPALLSGIDIKTDEPLGFFAWLRERFF